MAITTVQEDLLHARDSTGRPAFLAVREEDRPAPRKLRNTLLVLSLGALLRGCVVWYAISHLPAGWFYSRGLEMGLLADALMHGRGLSSPFGVAATGPTAMIAPGYPILVAGVFRLFGSYSFASLVTLLTGQLALNVMTLALILTLGRRVASERAAVLAGLLWGCSLPLLWMPTIFWETSFSACLLLGSVWLALRIAGRKGFAGYGVCCGLAGLINPALLPTLLAMGALCVWRSKTQHAQRLMLLLLGFCLAYGAWPLRNARTFHVWIPTRTTVGFELWMGNHARSSGYLEESLFPTYNSAELRQYEAQGEVEYFAGKRVLATEFIRTHPLAFARLTLVRVWRFWSGSGTRHGSIFFVLQALSTTLLGAVGLWALLRSGERQLPYLLALPLLLFPLPYYITHAEFRYRLNLEPVMTVLTAAGIERCMRRTVVDPS